MKSISTPVGAQRPTPVQLPPGQAPPQAFFAVSASFHYLGPAMAVLLFAHVNALGVAWLRIAGAAMVFAVWRRPWRLMRRLTRDRLRVLIGLGVVPAAMNTTFRLAVSRLPLSTVGAIESLGIIVPAAVGARTRRCSRGSTFALTLSILPTTAPP